MAGASSRSSPRGEAARADVPAPLAARHRDSRDGPPELEGMGAFQRPARTAAEVGRAMGMEAWDLLRQRIGGRARQFQPGDVGNLGRGHGPRLASYDFSAESKLVDVGGPTAHSEGHPREVPKAVRVLVDCRKWSKDEEGS